MHIISVDTRLTKKKQCVGVNEIQSSVCVCVCVWLLLPTLLPFLSIHSGMQRTNGGLISVTFIQFLALLISAGFESFLTEATGGPIVYSSAC